MQTTQPNNDWRPVTLPELATLLKATIKTWPQLRYTRNNEAQGHSIFSGRDTGIVLLPDSLVIGL